MSDLERLSQAMTAWARAEDPALGAIAAPALDEARASLASPNGRALGVARVAHTPLDDARSLWSASTAELLQLRLAADATADDVGAVLDRWLALDPAPLAEPEGERAWSLRLPGVARSATLALLDRGFAPATTTMVRPSRAIPAPATPPVGVRIRPPQPADAAAMAALARELVATEVAFGATRERAPHLADGYATEALAAPEGWTLVAEGEGDAMLGWASISPVAASAWAAPSTSLAPAAYLGIATVTAARRSGGIGRALVERLHEHARGEGVAATLLDASACNPWSVPFWHRQGYRPLWTTWQRRARPGGAA